MFQENLLTILMVGVLLGVISHVVILIKDRRKFSVEYFRKFFLSDLFYYVLFCTVSVIAVTSWFSVSLLVPDVIVAGKELISELSIEGVLGLAVLALIIFGGFIKF